MTRPSARLAAGAPLVRAQVGGVRFDYEEFGIQSGWSSGARAPTWIPDGHLGIEIDDRRCSATPDGEILYFNPDTPNYVMLLVRLVAEDASSFSLPIRFPVHPAAHATLFHQPSRKHRPIHRRAFGQLRCRDGLLLWHCHEIGALARDAVFEGLGDVFRAGRTSAGRRWAAGVAERSAGTHLVGLCARLLDDDDQRNRPLYVDRYHRGLRPLLEHLLACPDVASGSACADCARLAGNVGLTTLRWGQVLSLFARRGRHVPAASIPAGEEDGRGAALAPQELVERLRGLMRGGKVTPEERRAALAALKVVRVVDWWSAIPDVFRAIPVERGTLAGAPWSLIFALTNGLLRTDGVAVLCSDGWRGADTRIFQGIAHAVLEPGQPAAARVLAVMAAWETAPRQRHAVRPRLAEAAMRIARDVAAPEQSRILLSVASRLVHYALEGSATLNPKTVFGAKGGVLAPDDEDTGVALPTGNTPTTEPLLVEIEGLLRALPVDHVYTENHLLEAFRLLPWARDRIREIAFEIDPGSTLRAFWEDPRRGPDPRELETLVTLRAEEPQVDRARLLLAWSATSLALRDSVASMPPLPIIAEDGSVGGSAAYWRSFLWLAGNARRDRLAPYLRELVERLFARVRTVDDHEMENNAWLALANFVDSAEADFELGSAKQLFERLLEILDRPAPGIDRRAATLVRILAAESGFPPARFTHAWCMAFDLYAGDDKGGLRQLVLTALEQRPDVGGLVLYREVRSRLAAAIESSMDYLVVGAVRCLAASGGWLSPINWLLRPRDHGTFLRRERDRVLRAWVDAIRADDFSHETMRRRAVAWLRQLAQGEGEPRFYLDDGKHALLLRTLESLVPEDAVEVALSLARSGCLIPVAIWLSERTSGAEWIEDVLAGLGEGLGVASCESLWRVAERLSIFERFAPRGADALRIALNDRAIRSLDSERTPLERALLVNTFAATADGRDYPESIFAHTEQILANTEHQTQTARLARGVLSRVAEREADRAPGAPRTDWTALIESVRTEEPAGELLRFATWLSDPDLPDLRSGRSRAIVELVGARIVTLPDESRTIIEGAVADLLRGVTPSDPNARVEAVERGRGILRDMHALAMKEVERASAGIDVPASILIRVDGVARFVPPELFQHVGGWPPGPALLPRSLSLWRTLRFVRLARRVGIADDILHDLKFIRDEETWRQVTAGFAHELLQRETPDVRRYPNISRLAVEMASEIARQDPSRIHVRDHTGQPQGSIAAARLALEDFRRLTWNLVTNALRHGVGPVWITVDGAGLRVTNRIGPRGEFAPSYWELVNHYLGGDDLALAETAQPAHSGLRMVRSIARRNPALRLRADLVEGPGARFSIVWS